MKKTMFFFLISGIMTSCGGEKKEASTPSSQVWETAKSEPVQPETTSKGIGTFEKVELNDPLNSAWVSQGQDIYDLKCSACHKLSSKRVVGPGFLGVTERRTPEWIMNMITNVEVMLDQDPTAQKLLEECLTRMPNQNLTHDEARSMLEFLINNDKT